MKSETQIRYASSEDVSLLAELGKETFHDAFADYQQMKMADLTMYLNGAFTLGQISSELADPRAVFLIAEINKEAVGYAKMVFGAAEEGVSGQNPVKLQRLYARQRFVGQGVGASLMNRCLLEAADRENDVVWLRVWEYNLTAQSFYRKWFFEPVRSIQFQFGNSILTEILMQRNVDPDRFFPSANKHGETGKSSDLK